MNNLYPAVYFPALTSSKQGRNFITFSVTTSRDLKINILLLGAK